MSDDYLKELTVRGLHSVIGHLHLMIAGEEEINMEYLNLAEDICAWWEKR